MTKNRGFTPPKAGFHRNNNKYAGFTPPMAGFTFLELIVSMLILTTVCMVVLGMFAHGSLALKKSSQLSIAGLLAQSVMERTIYQSLDEIEANSVTTGRSADGFINFPTDKKWVNKRWKDFKYKVETITGNGELANFKKVKITVQTPLGSTIDLVSLKKREIQPLGSGIFYIANPPGANCMICYQDPVDTNKRGIIATKEIIVDFTVSLDRKKIFYYWTTAGGGAGDYKLGFINNETEFSTDDFSTLISDTEVATAMGNAHTIKWSPDNQNFSLKLDIAPGTGKFAIIGMGGNVIEKIEQCNHGENDWSPDGTNVVYVKREDEKDKVIIHPMGGVSESTITSYDAGAYNLYSRPTYTPDGANIILLKLTINPLGGSSPYSLSAIFTDSNGLNPSKSVTLYDNQTKLITPVQAFVDCNNNIAIIGWERGGWGGVHTNCTIRNISSTPYKSGEEPFRYAWNVSFNTDGTKIAGFFPRLDYAILVNGQYTYYPIYTSSLDAGENFSPLSGVPYNYEINKRSFYSTTIEWRD